MTLCHILQRVLINTYNTNMLQITIKEFFSNEIGLLIYCKMLQIQLQNQLNLKQRLILTPYLPGVWVSNAPSHPGTYTENYFCLLFTCQNIRNNILLIMNNIVIVLLRTGTKHRQIHIQKPDNIKKNLKKKKKKKSIIYLYI